MLKWWYQIDVTKKEAVLHGIYVELPQVVCIKGNCESMYVESMSKIDDIYTLGL